LFPVLSIDLNDPHLGCMMSYNLSNGNKREQDCQA
jgi:hypothetical protein